MDEAFKLGIGALCRNFPTIGIIDMNKQLVPSMFMAKSPLLAKKIGWNVIDEILLVIS
jgi:hypothetical protein